MDSNTSEQVSNLANDMEDPWAVCRAESNAKKTTTTIGPIDTFRNYEEEAVNSDSDEEQDIVFQDMQLFLHAIGEPQLVDLFLKNRVTLGQLLEFNEQDLINCGVEFVGDRKKILESTGQMHNEKWQPSSLHDLSSKSLLSSPGIYVALNDINKHIEYIGVTFMYIKRRLEERPEVLELGKDYVGVTKISQEIEDLLKTSKTSYSQLRMLGKEVSKHLNDPNKKPANHIDKDYIFKAKLRQRYVPRLVAGVAICAMMKLVWIFIGRK